MTTKPTPARQVLERVDVARRWVERSILWRIWLRMVENEFVDRSVALAAKAFVALLPMLVLIAAFTPEAVRTSIIGTLRRRLGVEDEALILVQDAFTTPEETRSATGVIGLVLVLLYATSFTTALQRIYLRVWRRPLLAGPSNHARGLVWLAGLVALMSMLGVMRRAMTGLPGTTAFALLALLASVAAWWATSWLMLRGEVRWRPLLASACLTAVATNLYAASASLWMPRTIQQNELQFGFFGVALALVTWLVGMCFLVMAAACAGAVLADDPGKVGRLLRGGNPSVLVPDAAPPQPPGPTGMRAAFGRAADVDPRDEP